MGRTATARRDITAAPTLQPVDMAKLETAIAEPAAAEHPPNLDRVVYGTIVDGKIVPADERAADADARACTCHPDDNPPVPCPQKFALAECRAAAAAQQTVAETREQLDPAAINPTAAKPTISETGALMADALAKYRATAALHVLGIGDEIMALAESANAECKALADNLRTQGTGEEARVIAFTTAIRDAVQQIQRTREQFAAFAPPQTTSA